MKEREPCPDVIFFDEEAEVRRVVRMADGKTVTIEPAPNGMISISQYSEEITKPNRQERRAIAAGLKRQNRSRKY